MNGKIMMIVAVLTAGAVEVLAEMGPTPVPAGDPVTENFFPPELVMGNQGAIGLSEDQKKSLRDLMQTAMALFTDLQWQMSAEQEKLLALMAEETIEETKGLEQFAKVLQVENQIKLKQLTLMIRIKNLLTAEQQTRLRDLKRRAMVGMGPQGQRPPSPTPTP